MKPFVEEFFVTLALCHTVQVSVPTARSTELQVTVRSSEAYVNDTFNPDEFDYEYEASSPDEKALVEACRRYRTITLKNYSNSFLKN